MKTADELGKALDEVRGECIKTIRDRVRRNTELTGEEFIDLEVNDESVFYEHLSDHTNSFISAVRKDGIIVDYPHRGKHPMSIEHLETWKMIKLIEALERTMAD